MDCVGNETWNFEGNQFQDDDRFVNVTSATVTTLMDRIVAKPLPYTPQSGVGGMKCTSVYGSRDFAMPVSGQFSTPTSFDGVSSSMDVATRVIVRFPEKTASTNQSFKSGYTAKRKRCNKKKVTAALENSFGNSTAKAGISAKDIEDFEAMLRATSAHDSLWESSINSARPTETVTTADFCQLEECSQGSSQGSSGPLSYRRSSEESSPGSREHCMLQIKEKNRMSAKVCRAKKKEYVRCLEQRVVTLEKQNSFLMAKLSFYVLQ